MSSQIASVVLGLAILCWSGGVFAKALGKCSLSGRIKNTPRGGFSVKLKPVEKSPLAMYDGYSSQVSPDGSFQFGDVDPGRYVVVAEGAGFMPTEYGADGLGQTGTPIELKAGQRRTSIVIKLTPKHVVCGKVTDEHGNPLPNVEVYAFAHPKGSMWLAGGTYTVTDNDGNYRLPDLQPGEFFIQAGMSTWFFGSKKVTQTEAEDLANAEPVEVGPDESTECGEDIRIGPRLGYRGFKIRGKIAEDPALKDKDLVLSLLEVNRTGVARVVPPTEIIDPGPSFELWSEPPGRYRLILSEGRYPPNGYAGQPAFTVLSSQEISLADADVNGITVAPDPVASLSGQVKLEDITAAAACPTREKTHLRIQKKDDSQFLNVELDADGKFSFAQVQPGTYSVSLYPFLRGTVYVKSMLFDGNPVDGREINISSVATHSLEVALSGDRTNASGHFTPDENVERYQAEGTHPKASVSGRVTNAIAANPLWVKLWAVRFNSDRSYEYSTRPAPDGSFHFENVDPGIYLLVAQGLGYALSEYGASYPSLEGKAITLSAGQRLDGLTLNTFPRSPSLCGQVRDENGRPLPNVTVFAAPSLSSGTGPGLNANVNSSSNTSQSAASMVVVSLGPPGVNTDSAGDFQFFDLRPGQYFLWTDFLAPNDPDGTRQWTYYPSSPNFDGAQPIQVGFGPDAGCTHTIQMHTASTFHVRGRVPTEIAHAEEEYFDINLVETNAAGLEGIIQTIDMLGPGDAFDFAHVRSGHYSIRLTGPFRKPQSQAVSFVEIHLGCPAPNYLIASQEVAVRDADRNDVALETIPRLSVAGKIHFEDIPKEWRSFSADAQSVTLSPAHGFLSLRGAQILSGVCPERAKLNSDGAFSFESVSGGVYEVGVDLTGVQGDELYLKSIALNGRPVEGRRIILKPGQPAELTLVVSNNGGEVDAQVKPSGPPAEEYRFDEPCRPKMAVNPVVWLIPDAIPADASGIVTGAFTTAGLVEIPRVPPGRYHAVAGENFNGLFHFTRSPGDSSVWTDPKFLQSVSALGTPVEVAAGQKIKLLLLSDATAQIQDLLAKYKEEVSIGDHCVASCSYDGFWNGAETAQAKKHKVHFSQDFQLDSATRGGP